MNKQLLLCKIVLEGLKNFTCLPRYHDNDIDLLLPQHLPEVTFSVGKWSLQIKIDK